MTRSTGRLAAKAIALIVVIVLLSACEIAGLGSPSSSSLEGTTDPSPSDPTVAGPGCLQMDVATNPIPQTVKHMAAISSTVLVGTFKGYGVAVWNTPDGSRPLAKSFRETDARLVRPLMLALDAPVRGDNAAGLHAIEVGGSLGCDRVTYSDQVELDAGARYVLFLAPVADSSGKVAADVALVDAWVVGDDDVVQTRFDGRLPLAELSKAVAATPYGGTQ